MAYIGRDTDKISNVEVLDNITFDGSSSYTLQKNSVNFTPSSANTLLVSIDGVVQAGNFTVSGSTIDFGTAVAGTSTCNFILHYGIGLITSVSDGTVTTAKLGANSVTAAKLNNDIISGATELATTPADTDEFLVSDAGTLKRIDYSHIKGSTFDTLDIDGATDIGANISDNDLFIVDDGANGTNRKAAASRLIDYVGVAYKEVHTSTNLGSGTQVNYDGVANASGIILIKNRTRGHKSPVAFYSRGGGGIGFYYVWLSLDDGWEVETSSNSISFQETGADVNTYTVNISSGGGAVTVERTGGSQNYDVRIYTLDLKTD